MGYNIGAGLQENPLNEFPMNINRLFILAFYCLLSAHSPGQDTAAIISQLDKDLVTKQKTISGLLSDPAYMYLHSLTPFREIIKKHTGTDPVTIVTPDEPGIRIVVNGTVTDRTGKPLDRVLIYFYQTSTKGWYSDTGVHIRRNEGDHRHSRLFGYVKTDANGRFNINTIRPNGYPGSDFAGHIHIQMWNKDGTYLTGIPGELQFSDDPRMTEQRRKISIADGYLIANNEGSVKKPVYHYQIRSKSD